MSKQQQQQQRYRVIERIAAGGMAEVYRAESAGLEGFKKKVAIKRVLPHLAEKREFIGMFLDEARLSAHLNHSNVVQVFDIGQGDNTYFIVMEMVEGADLKAIAEYHRAHGTIFPVEEACLICVRICEGLAYAHELPGEDGSALGIVHRDMSPPNVLITRYGEVKIADFGLAKANSQLEQSQPGVIKGKFGYLSPEAAHGREVDARTDIFAVGIILWELLAGRRLFLGKTDLETVKAVQRADVPDIRQFNPHVPPSVQAVLGKLLAGDPNRRYTTAREAGHDLNQVLFGLPRAVSSFDISKLVIPVQDQALRERRRVLRQSIIGTLIDQALFEFTSVKDDDEGGLFQASSPLDVRSFAGLLPTKETDHSVDWGSTLHGGTPLAGEALELGNLSALEDAESPRPPGTLQRDFDDESEVAPRIMPSDLVRPSTRAPRRGGSLALVIAVIVVAAGAGAYFAGVIPKSLLHAVGL
jgi:serine/threonine protein kinase